MLGGGVFRGRSTFLLGPSGSGKTTLALQFVMEGVRRGEQALYVSFEENPTQLDSQIRALGFDPEDARGKGLRFLYVSPVELQIDSIVATIFHAIRDGDIQRVAIDAVGDLVAATNDVHRLHSYLYALSQHFAVNGVTSMFPYEIGANRERELRLSALGDNIIALGVEIEGGKGRRTMRIVKARGIDHDLDERQLRISGRGVEVS